MSDDEFDEWIHEVNTDMAQTLNEVVDTEADLRRLKQKMLRPYAACRPWPGPGR